MATVLLVDSLLITRMQLGPVAVVVASLAMLSPMTLKVVEVVQAVDEHIQHFFREAEIASIMNAVECFHEINDLPMDSDAMRRAMCWAATVAINFAQLKSIIDGETVFTVPIKGPVQYYDLVSRASSEDVDISSDIENQLREIISRRYGTDEHEN